ncbi:MAG: hypothetical protein OXD54_15465 [Candidatus Poribacteria bacterium]|nr:hypothetical protein [Candidatus Poribacteria bacterium]
MLLWEFCEVRNRKKIAWLVKQIPIIGIILLIALDELLANSVSERWLPALGFVLGAGLVCFGYFNVFPFFNKIKTMDVTSTEKIAWISGITLAIFGGAVINLNNSIAAIFYIQWLRSFMVATIIGCGFLCIAYWIMTLFGELFKSDRIWKICGIVIHCLLLASVVVKYTF